MLTDAVRAYTLGETTGDAGAGAGHLVQARKEPIARPDQLHTGVVGRIVHRAETACRTVRGRVQWCEAWPAATAGRWGGTDR